MRSSVENSIRFERSSAHRFRAPFPPRRWRIHHWITNSRPGSRTLPSPQTKGPRSSLTASRTIAARVSSAKAGACCGFCPGRRCGPSNPTLARTCGRVLGGKMYWTLAIAVAIVLCAVPSATQAQSTESVLGCPLLTQEMAAKAAAMVKGNGRCQATCNGCGCKGGPGYRGPRGCVGYSDLIRVCGPPPHARCNRECKPVVPACADKAFGVLWLKALARNVWHHNHVPAPRLFRSWKHKVKSRRNHLS